MRIQNNSIGWSAVLLLTASLLASFAAANVQGPRSPFQMRADRLAAAVEKAEGTSRSVRARMARPSAPRKPQGTDDEIKRLKKALKAANERAHRAEKLLALQAAQGGAALDEAAIDMIQALQEDLSTLGYENEGLATRCREAELLAADAVERTELAESHLSTEKTRVSGLEGDLQRSRQRLGETTSKLARANTKLQSTDRDVDAVEARLRDVQRKYGDLEDDHGGLSNLVWSLRAEVASQQRDLTSLRDDFNGLVDDYGERLDDLNEANSRTEKAWENAKCWFYRAWYHKDPSIIKLSGRWVWAEPTPGTYDPAWL